MHPSTAVAQSPATLKWLWIAVGALGASVLALGWWALLWCVAQGQPWLRQAPRWQGLALGMVLAWAMVVLAAATAATASRTGTLQWLLVLATLVLWRRTLGREVLALALLGTLAYALAAWLLPLLLQSLHKN